MAKKVKKEKVDKSLGTRIVEAAAYVFRGKESDAALLRDFIDRDEDQFRDVSQGVTKFRDISRFKHERTLQIAYILYLGYPLAKRGLEITRDFIVGEGITFKAKDKTVQEVLDLHWKDPVNNWNIKQFNKAFELGLYGEQFYPVFINPENGLVRLGYIDPINVNAVISDPENVEIVKEVQLKASKKDNASTPIDAEKDLKRLEVIHVDEDPESDTFGMQIGEIFVFQINKVVNASRGNTDLLAAIDWLETHEQYLFTIHEAAMIKAQVLWDVTVKGADLKKLKELEKAFGSNIKPGSVRFHNDKMTVKPEAPVLNMDDAAEHASLIKTHVAAALGYPVHWLCDPSTGNRATATEMGVPTTKMLRAKQRFFRNLIATIFDFQIDQAIIAKKLKADVDKSYEIFTPQIWASDLEKIARSLFLTGRALTLAIEKQLISQERAVAIFDYISSQLGLGAATFDISTEKGEVDDSTGDTEKSKITVGNNATPTIGDQPDAGNILSRTG